MVWACDHYTVTAPGDVVPAVECGCVLARSEEMGDAEQ